MAIFLPVPPENTSLGRPRGAKVCEVFAERDIHRAAMTVWSSAHRGSVGESLRRSAQPGDYPRNCSSGAALNCTDTKRKQVWCISRSYFSLWAALHHYSPRPGSRTADVFRPAVTGLKHFSHRPTQVPAITPPPQPLTRLGPP